MSDDEVAKANVINAHWQLAKKLAADHKCDAAKKELAALPPTEQAFDKVKKIRETCR